MNAARSRDIDELDRPRRRRRHHGVGAAVADEMRMDEARHPVAEAIGRVVRADDETGTYVEPARTVDIGHDTLARSLERSVELADLFTLGIRERADRVALGEPAAAGIGEHGDRRHEEIPAHARRQQLRRRPHDARDVAGRVHHRVPLARGERLETGRVARIAVADARIDPAAPRIGLLAAGEDRHLVATRQRGVDEMPAEKARAAEDEQLHRFGRQPLGTIETPLSFSCASISDGTNLSPKPISVAFTRLWCTASPTMDDDRQRLGEVRVVAQVLRRIRDRELHAGQVALVLEHLAHDHLEDAAS